MASGVLLNISRNEIELARLESEYKAKIDIQARIVDATREGEARGEAKKSTEILDLIAKGYTAADIKSALEAGR